MGESGSPREATGEIGPSSAGPDRLIALGVEGRCGGAPRRTGRARVPAGQGHSSRGWPLGVGKRACDPTGGRGVLPECTAAPHARARIMALEGAQAAGTARQDGEARGSPRSQAGAEGPPGWPCLRAGRRLRTRTDLELGPPSRRAPRRLGRGPSALARSGRGRPAPPRPACPAHGLGRPAQALGPLAPRPRRARHPSAPASRAAN